MCAVPPVLLVQPMPTTAAPYLVKVPCEAGIQDNVQQQHLEDSGRAEGGLTVDRQVQRLPADAALCRLQLEQDVGIQGDAGGGQKAGQGPALAPIGLQAGHQVSETDIARVRIR